MKINKEDKLVRESPIILAKSALRHEQLAVKEILGCDGIEIQLLNELNNPYKGEEDSRKYRSHKEAFTIAEFCDYNIRVVHSPIFKDNNGQNVGMCLEDSMHADELMMVYNLFEIAQFFAKDCEHKVILVIHCECQFDKLVKEGVWDFIVQKVEWLLQTHPDVVLGIENITPLRGTVDGEIQHLYNNFAFESVEIVRKLREYTKSDRIVTVLDTCNAMASEKYLNVLHKEFGEGANRDLSLDSFFRDNRELVDLVHLSNYSGSGYGKGRHGIAFTEETENKLKEILDLYVKYEYSCPITLEINEDSYLTCDGYTATKKLVDKYFNEKISKEGN